MKRDRLFKKTTAQKIKDFIFLPVRFALADPKVEKLGLTSLRQERFNICLEHTRGKTLDIGCGENQFIIAYRKSSRTKSIGVDAFKWQEVDIVCDTTKLPFKDNSFETVTIIASLNHIPKREKVLDEAYRVLRPAGQMLVTMIDPVISRISHTFIRKRFDRDQKERGGMKKGEVYGFWPKEMIGYLSKAGFRSIKQKSFIYGLNRLYIGKKPGVRK
jgi:ubiquinone/menaquinone biosynthesis C-methylase UbiE